MADEKDMVCAGFKADDEKACVAGGGKWMDREDILLTGVAANKGEVIATVRVVNADKTKMANIAPGEVLVGEGFEPADNIYLKKAVALITNTGGELGHAGVAGKMYGYPAVTGTVVATKVLKDGQRVIVDGTRGVILRVHPGMEVEAKPKPKPAAVSSLAERMAAVAAKNKIDLPHGFTEKQKEKEQE